MRARARYFVGLFLVVLLTPAFAQAPGWVLYTHPDKLMSARFPEKPNETDQESAIGKIRFKLALFTDGNRAYIASAVVYSIRGKFDVKKALDGARDQALANIKGKVISEEPIKLDGFDGRQVRFDTPGGDQQHIRGVVRLFASASPPGVYVASAMELTGKPDPDAQKFLDSLHLGKKVEASP